MKGARLFLMLMGLLLSLTSILPAAERAGIVKDARVNVRGKPSLTGEVITQVRQGERVTILEEITDKHAKTNAPAKWFKIAMPENTPLWVNTNFLDAANQVKPNKLNIRGGPGENFSVVGSLTKGHEVKTIRIVGDWMEIETPPGAYGFVAADLITPGPAVEIAQKETPPEKPAETPTEVVKTDPASIEEKPAEVPVQAVEKKTEEVAVTTPPEVVAVEPAKPEEKPVEEPVAAVPAQPPAKTAEEPTESDLPKRIVVREGVVKRAKSIQSPSHFALENEQSSELVNYLHSTNPDINLKLYMGYKVIVTGEEFIDPRWPAIPLIHVDKIELP